MWIVLWVVLSGFVCGIVIWQMRILYQQKNAWQAFAKKHNFDYLKGPAMGSPGISGTFDGFQFMTYSDIQQTNDVRGQRYITAIEFGLGAGMPTGAAIVPVYMKPALENLGFHEAFIPEGNWDDGYILQTRDAERLKEYLTADRVKALNDLFAMKSSSVMFFFDESESVLRVETSDPLRNAEHMDKIMGRLLAMAKKLALTSAEEEKFKAFAKDTKKQTTPPLPETDTGAETGEDFADVPLHDKDA